MTIVETTVTFANKGEEIKRLERKNDKRRLSWTIVDIHHIAFSDCGDAEKIEKIKQLTAASYW